MGIAVLGPLRLDDAVLGRRDRIVLAALALRPGESVSADRLADAIWQDDVPPSAAKIVQGCVVRLRKRLGPGAVETSDHGYRLNLSLDEIDAHLFEREVRRARQLLEGGEPDRAVAVARDALRLWRGDPWPDLAAWDSARVDAARLGELHREAQELHCEALLATGRPDEVISLARALVGDEPLRERRWLLLARAQYQTGLQSDALATLRQVRMTLGRELGLDPGPEIVDLETAILRQDPSLVASARRREPSTTCPYPGLTAYDVSDAETFFGREREVQTCLRRLASVPLLVVAGPSGSGKSSLVRAGVAAVLARSGRSVVTLTPGTHPMTELDQAAPVERAVLVVDQAEELVTLAADDERQAFLDYLLTRTDTAPVVLAVRTDHLGEIAGRPEVARRVEQGLYLLGPMDDTALRQAVEGPAHAAGLTLEPGLVELLVAEAGDQAGALPLLSHAMQETWTRREGGTLTVAGYRATGGIRGAIAQTAEGVYQQAGDERADVVRSLMLRLVASGPDGDPTPVHVPRRAIEDDVRIQGVVDLLIRSRLVTTDGGTLTIAHEALARAWPRLRGWLEDDVEGQRILHHLAAAAEAWDSMGRPDSELYRGARLAKVLAWRRSAAAQLTGAEKTFLDRSAALARAEEQLAWEQARRQRRTNQRLRLMLAAACALLLVAAAAGVYALRQNHVAGAAADQARHAATVADSRRLGARALIANDISESLLLAVAGVRRDDSPETRSDLAAALQKRPLLARSFRGGHGTPISMDVSPDGGTVATGIDQGQVWLKDTATGRALGHYDATSDHTGLHGVIPAFSPDGRFLAVGLDFADRTPLRLLDPRELRPATPALDLGPAAGGQVEQVDFSPGGDHLAAVVKSADGSQVFALVWELAHPDQPPERVDLDPVDQGLALGPRGRVVYTQQPLTAYDVRTGRQLWRRPVKGFRALDLNRTGTQLAMERWDDKKNNDVLLVDARNGHVRRTLVGQAEQVLKVRYSTDGRLLASSAFDGSLVIWDTSTGEVRERMQGAPFVTAMALSPDAHTLYSAAGSEPVRVWDLTGDRRFLSKQSSSPALPMYSSSMWPTQNASKFAYFWGNDRGTFVRFVDTSSGHATVDRNTHQDGSFAAGRWSPDSLRWATGDGRGRLLVFDPSNARQVASGKVLPGLIDEVEYTADGRSLVAVDDHGRVRVADATTLRPTSPVLDLGDWGCCLAAAPHSHSVVVFTSRSGNDGVQGDARHWAVVDTDSARIVRQGTVPSAVFYSDWSPDGTTIVGVGAGNRVLAIDERTGRVRVSAPASQNTDSYWVRYSRDGRELVSAAINGSVSLWDSHLRLLGTVTTPQEVPAAAGFSPDGRVLIASLDGGIYSWDPSARHAMAFACRAAGRRLTHLEWRDNFGTQAYQDLCPR